MGAIRRAFKAHKEEALYFEAVFACHHDVDPVGIGIEILNKFGTDSKYIQEVNFLCTIPPKALRNYETVAYKILFHSFSDGNIKLRWKKPREQLDEVLFPKHVLCRQEVIRILNEAGGSLVSHSKKRNGCFDFEADTTMPLFLSSLVVLLKAIRKASKPLSSWHKKLQAKIQIVLYNLSAESAGGS